MAFRRRNAADRTGEDMTMVGHLAELRMRIVRCLLAISIGAAAILIFYDQVLQFLTKPYRNLCDARPDLECNGALFVLGPIEGLAQRMRIAGYGGLIIALPIIFWQLWRFIVPALNKREKRYTVPFIFTSVLLFALGGALAYWTLDKALEFLISWSGKDVTQAYQISKYISLVALMVLAFGVGFLVPVLVVFLQLVGVVTPQTLIRQWRYSFLGVFAVAAVITPSGDPISMMALAIPMTILLLIAILIGYIVERRRSKQPA